MDFYWHYSGKETVDAHGKENFCRAINVAKQVFNTLTEYIQVEQFSKKKSFDVQSNICFHPGSMSTKSISLSQQSIMGCHIRISLHIRTYATKIISSKNLDFPLFYVVFLLI